MVKTRIAQKIVQKWRDSKGTTPMPQDYLDELMEYTRDELENTTYSPLEQFLYTMPKQLILDDYKFHWLYIIGFIYNDEEYHKIGYSGNPVSRTEKVIEGMKMRDGITEIWRCEYIPLGFITREEARITEKLAHTGVGMFCGNRTEFSIEGLIDNYYRQTTLDDDKRNRAKTEGKLVNRTLTAFTGATEVFKVSTTNMATFSAQVLQLLSRLSMEINCKDIKGLERMIDQHQPSTMTREEQKLHNCVYDSQL